MRTAVILILLACLAYANSLYAPFVYDDLTSIQHNHVVRFFSFDAKQFLETRSLLYPTYAFNEWLGGENVFGYHVINLLLHIFNGLLVFAIARRIYRKLRPSALLEPSPYQARALRPLPQGEDLYALMAAAFFLVHPLQTEAVTYITERSELLSKLVYLCGLLFFMAIPEQKIGFFASLPVMFCLVLGLGFKETAVTLPAIILLYDYLFISKTRFRNMLSRWRFYSGMLLFVAAGAYVFRNALLRPLVEVGRPGTLRPWHFVLTELRVIARYLRLIVLPIGQNLDYDFPASFSIKETGVLLSLLLIVALLALAWRWRSQKPVYTFSILWFFIALAPLSSIVPIPDVIAEHRLYLSLAGVCLSFPLLVESLFKKRLVPAGAAILTVFLIATVARNYVWADEFRLFSDVVAKSPHKLRAYENLIFAHMKQGQEDRAISIANAAIQNVSDGDRVSLLDTIGNLYLRMGRSGAAVQMFRRSNEEALRVHASNGFIATSFNNLGTAYLAQAKEFNGPNEGLRIIALLSAREAFQKSLERLDDVAVLDSLVNVNHQLGQSSALEQQLRQNLAANPNEFKSVYMLATLLSLGDRYHESVNYFRQAAEQQKQSEVIHFNYAFALSKAGEIEQAIDEYVRALRIDPLFQEAHYNLALLYLQKLNYSSALEHLNAIVSVEASNTKANMKLAQIYVYQGKLAEARQHLQQVLKVNPQDRDALSLFAQIGG